MNELQLFNFEGNEVRTLKIDEEPLFVGKDVAEILGYSNPRKALKDHVDEEDKKDGVTIRDSIGRDEEDKISKIVNESQILQNAENVNDSQRMVTVDLINESGLYSLILSSKMPNAKKFKHWVTSEVLPAIRKNGAYQ